MDYCKSETIDPFRRRIANSRRITQNLIHTRVR